MTASAPNTWDLKNLTLNWHSYLRSILEAGHSDLPFERLLFQAQADNAYSDIVANWSKMSGKEKQEAWDTLQELADKGKDEMLPICVRCGICCKNGSPTLSKDDLELVSSGHIPIETLVTIRQGEPVHSKNSDKAYLLPEEKIKIKENPGSKTCAMYDAAHNSCGLHPHKPAQCRAQACWDPSQSQEQAGAPALCRTEVLAGADQMMTLIAAHEDRTGYARFIRLFETLGTDGEDAMSSLLEMLAFDEHVRDFAQKELAIPEEALPFLFGKRLAKRVRLFGYRVEYKDDGTRILQPMDGTSPH